jgi:uncharacterized delta-60 repeat protein
VGRTRATIRAESRQVSVKAAVGSSDNPSMSAGRRLTRAHARALALVAFACAIAASSAGGATSTTVVSVVVPSATELTKTTCADNTAGSTSLGVVLPGSTLLGTADCVLTWGSSNDSSTLRIYQTDGQGTGMFRPADGTMDPTFSGDGMSDVVNPGFDDEVRSVGVQSTGKVVLGTLGGRISRLMADGTVDAGFGASGHLNVSAQVGSPDVLLVDSSDRIYAAGSNGGRAAVARYSAAGVLDGSFGSGGVAAYGPFQTSEAAVGMKFDSTGRILIGARSYDSTNYDAAIIRLTAGGQLDTSFNAPNGYQVVQINTTSQLYPSVAVATDDAVYIAGHSSTNLSLIAKVDSAGALVSGFGTAGVLTMNAAAGNDDIRGLAVHPDGDVVAVGDYNSQANSLVIKVDGATGAPEATFGGGDGILDLDLGAGLVDVYRTVVVQPDGKLVVQGRQDTGAPEGMELVVHRLLPTGAFDTTFGGGDGKTFHHLTAGGSVDDRGSSNGELVLWTDGSIIAVGESADPANAFAIRMAGRTFPDWLSGTNDWAVVDAGAFAACLHTLGGSATAQTWAVAGLNNCTTSLPANWHAVPTAPVAIGRLSAAGTTTVNMRFGVRATPTQAPGDYVAPVTFEVTAP